MAGVVPVAAAPPAWWVVGVDGVFATAGLEPMGVAATLISLALAARCPFPPVEDCTSHRGGIRMEATGISMFGTVSP